MSDETTDGDHPIGADVVVENPTDDDLLGTDTPQADRPQTARRAAIAVGVVVAALIAVLAWGGGGDDNSQSLLIGNRVPAVVGTDLDGQNYDIDDRRGQWVIVNFFATWCPPCVAEHPELLALSEWGQARADVELVSVVFNEPDPDPVRRFFTERGGDWPVVYGEPSIPIDFQVAQIPETFVVAPSGQVVAHIPGETTAAEIENIITSFDGAGS